MLDPDIFPITGSVERFPQKGGWYFVRVPKKYTHMTKDRSERGLVAIIARVGETQWPTSLLPMGDGTHFLALPAKVRSSEHLQLGDTVTAQFQLRER